MQSQTIKALIQVINELIINDFGGSNELKPKTDYEQSIKDLDKCDSLPQLLGIYENAIILTKSLILSAHKPEKHLKYLLNKSEKVYLDMYEHLGQTHLEIKEKISKNIEKIFAKESKLLFDAMRYNKPILDLEFSDIYRYGLKNKVIESIRSKNYLIFSVIVLEDDLTGTDVLGLLIRNTIFSNRNEFFTKTDHWGSGLIWPFSKEGYEFLVKLLTIDAITEINEKLNLDNLAEQINNCNPEEVIQLFPKTVQKFKRSNNLKNKFYIKSLP